MAGNRTFSAFAGISGELAKGQGNFPLRDEAESRSRLRSALLDSVRHHLVADVPVGIFLSSGLDSSTLAALAVEAGQKELHSVTLGFREYQGTPFDEVPLAEAMARHIGASHRTIWVGRDDFRDELGRLLDAMDQPTIDGINSYFVCKAAVTAGLKVAISGLGGDELFGGYDSFRQIPQLVRVIGPPAAIPGLGRAFRLLAAPVLKHFTSPKYAGLLEYGGSFGGAYLLRHSLFMPWELPTLLDGELVREGWRELQTLSRLEKTVDGIDSPRCRVSALEMQWYMRNQLLRDTDWASMAHSLEVRVPLVDLTLLREVAPLLINGSMPDKTAMAAAPARPLPPAILERKKTGFSVPVREWLLEGTAERSRGLRGWAMKVYREFANKPA
jgi:asparagine synthase (glutamine-hydrolysing)